jgi:hypothetical protein
LNDADTWVFWSAIVFSVTEIPDPGFEGGRVVLADVVAVGDDVGGAGEGSPFSRGVKEGDVDV